MKDMVGNTPRVGGYVAHVARTGSHMHWTRRRVVEVGDDYIKTVTPPQWGEGRAKITKVTTHFVVVP